jgi:hypothetical protein
MRLRFAWISLIALVFAMSPLTVHAATVAPIPDDSVYALFTSGGTSTFNPITGELTYTGLLQAVQFPNQILSFTDPLVTAGAILTVDEFFTGTSLDSLFTLDQSAKFLNSLTEITVGGKVVFSEFEKEYDFEENYTVAGGFYTDYKGAFEAVTTADSSVISSPFMEVLASIPSNDSKNPPSTQTLVWNPDGTVNPTARMADPTTTAVPEPSSFWFLGEGALAVVLLASRSKGVSRV